MEANDQRVLIHAIMNREHEAERHDCPEDPFCVTFPLHRSKCKQLRMDLGRRHALAHEQPAEILDHFCRPANVKMLLFQFTCVANEDAAIDMAPFSLPVRLSLAEDVNHAKLAV